MECTKTFDYNINAFVNPDIRTIINQGGSSSSKTYSILQMFIQYCLRNKKKELISIVSESMPHLKRGCIRDFQNIMEEDGLWNGRDWNKTEATYKLGNKQIEFFGADSPDKLKGGRRDFLYINECNNVGYEAYTQLEIRTRRKVLLDYNPSHEFWVDTEGLRNFPKTSYIKTTYKDNNLLEQSVIDSIESRRATNPEWYKVYGLGEMGSLEGAVYKNWSIVDKYPEGLGNKEAYFLDFGYTNDPTAFGRACIYDNESYTEELIYEKRMTNNEIIKRFEELEISKRALIIADCAEPKSIAQIRDAGFNIIPCEKGKDSIEFGINTVNDYKTNVTKKSINAIKEFRMYSWIKNKLTGQYINTPIDDFNHFLDGYRYWAIIKLGIKPHKTYSTASTGIW